MLIGKLLKGKSRDRSVFITSLLAGTAFIAVAVWAWGLSLNTVGEFLWITLVCLAAIILIAAVCVAIVVGVKKVWRRLN